MRKVWGERLRRYPLSVLIIPLALSLYWLCVENHSVWGDEAWHIMFLRNAVDKFHGESQSAPLLSLWNLYRFYPKYPPFFYLVAAPWVLLPSDPVLGGRVFAAILSGIVVFLLYRIARLVADRSIAMLAVLAVFTSPVFLEISRHFILEIGVAAWLLFLVYASLQYWATGRKKWLWAFASSLGLSLLTKASFFLFAPPFVVLVLARVYLDVRTGQAKGRDAFRNLIILALPSLLFAAPWYFDNIFINNDGYLESLKFAHASNQLMPVSSFSQFLSDSVSILGYLLPPVVYLAILALFLVLFLGARRQSASIQKMPLRMSLTPKFMAGVCSGAMVFIGFVLHATGTWNLPRWNMEYFFIILIFCALLQQMPHSRWQPATISILAVILSYCVVQNAVYPLPSIRLVTGNPNDIYPNPQPTGMKEVAKLISDFDKHLANPTNGTVVPVFFHVHAGAHTGALTFYFQQIDPRFNSAGFVNNNLPVRLNFLVDSTYVVELQGKVYGDEETERYIDLYANRPASFRALETLVGSVPSRFGLLNVYYKPKGSVSLKTRLELIAVGQQHEKNPAYQVFWKVELAQAHLRERNAQSFQLASEGLEDILAHLPESKQALSPYVYGYLENEVRALQTDVAEVRATGKG